MLRLNGLAIVLIDHCISATVNCYPLKTTKDHDVVFLHRKGVEIAKFLWQTDLDETPQIKIGIESFYAIIKVGPGVSTPTAEHIDVLLFECTAAGIDSFDVHS